jgi:AraC-like DNA-binding protein
MRQLLRSGEIKDNCSVTGRGISGFSEMYLTKLECGEQGGVMDIEKQTGQTLTGGDTAAPDAWVHALQRLCDDKELLFQIIEKLPVPIEIFAPDGTAVFLNQACLKLIDIHDMSQVAGQYNLLTDPVCNDQMGMRNDIQKAFLGEAGIWRNWRPPIQDIVDRGLTEEKPFDTAFMDVYLYPVMKAGLLAYVVCVFVVKETYQGSTELIKAKEYIDKHWQGGFDYESAAKAANVSVSKLYKLFKEQDGMTPGEYHKKRKIDRIKRKLADKNLSIAEAFSACGEDSRGRAAKIFKQITGLSPREYRAGLR